jgi:BolA protein
MNTEDRIRQCLATLAPEHLDLNDDSALHAGHVGAQGGGGHYSVTIVSAAFAGQSTVARHRLVYRALGPLMQHEIHALALRAIAPDEL